MEAVSHVGFKCDTTGDSIPLPHFWEHTVGSCHATIALRADWQRQLSQSSRELGFRHVRFHGLLSDDIGTLVCVQDKLVYSFFNTDQIIDFLLSIGMRPFMELSFMPTALSSGSDTVFHYKGNVTPPKDYDAWETLIQKMVKHWAERYGTDEVRQWFFEVWNEPNLDVFWKGTQADYFKLYRHTVSAIKNVHKEFKCGGPATAMNAWVNEFIAFCRQNELPVDFISTHHYPTDAFGEPGDDTVTQLSQSRRSVLREQAMAVKEQAGGRPVYYTEWSSSASLFDELHDMPYAAAFIIKTIMEANGIAEGYSYWTFSDIFEEKYFSSVPFHGGFGLMNIHGVPKPAYRAFELLHRLGNELLPVEGIHGTVDVWVVKKPGIMHILITNWALPLHDIKTELIVIQLRNLAEPDSAYIERIDEDHGNAPKAWYDMGEPDYLNDGQIHTLNMLSLLRKERIPVKYENNLLIMETVMPPQSVACITIEIA